VRDKVEKSGRTVYQTSVPQPHQHPLDSMIRALVLILGTLGFLSLFLSVFLVLNTISALLTQQVRQIGMMKAIGARAGQIAGMYVGMVLAFGVLALIVAVPLGIFGTRIIAHSIARLLNFDITTGGLPPQVLALEIVVAVIFPPLVALWPILKGTRITVREAITSYGVDAGGFGTSWIDRLVGRIHALPRPLLLSLRNSVRRKARLSLTLATLTLGGAIFMAVFSVRASALRSIEETISTWNHQLHISLNRSYRADRLVYEALKATMSHLQSQMIRKLTVAIQPIAIRPAIAITRIAPQSPARNVAAFDQEERNALTSGVLPAAVLGIAATCSILILGTCTCSCANDCAN
jgi:putative ABC transport system permease protein